MSRTPRTIVITGANTGIGLETAVSLAAQGERVIIACRNQDKAATALAEIRERSKNDHVESVPLDLASLASVRSAVAEIANRTAVIDVLVNNAGLILSSRSETEDGFETQFGVNHLGPFLLTTMLEPQIKASTQPRIVNLSSMAHWGAVGGLKFDNLQSTGIYNGWLTYARAKLANLFFAQELATRWGNDGVTAHAAHPGVVKSHFGKDGDTGGLSKLMLSAGQLMTITPSQGAQTSVYLASAAQPLESNGGYWTACKPARTAPWGHDPAAAKRLWDISEDLIAAGHP